MKRVIQLFFIVFLVGFLTDNLSAQKLEIEKTYKISGKAKRGALGNVEFDSQKGTYTLTYVTKSNEKRAKFEIYTFDRDFNFINKVDDEVEFDKVKTKYKWFVWRGELYTTLGNYVEPNLLGTLVLRQKEITYKYDWFLLGYYKTVKLLKKVKPKTDDGRVFHYYTHAEDDVTGDVLILCGLKGTLKTAKEAADPNGYLKNFVVLKYNKDLDLVSETSFDFQYPQSLAFTRSISKSNPDDPENPGIGGMAFVFAPMGGPGMGKYEDPEKTNYTYVRVDENAKIVDKIPFKSFASYWKLDELVIDNSTDDVYLFGPSAAGKDKYYNQLTTTQKFKAVQLMKISNHAVGYFTETNLEMFESKLRKPPSQKKSPAYEGKKFEIASYHIASTGDFFVTGQNFKTSKKGNQYNDILGFQFDNNGKLKAQYSVDTKETNSVAKSALTPQFFIENPSQGNMYWFLQEIKGLYRIKVLSYPRVAKVELGAANINDFQDYGRKSKFYLDTKYPYLETDKGNTVVFFGADKGGGEIWFVRIKLE